MLSISPTDESIEASTTMGSTQLPNFGIDLDEDYLNYDNILNGSQCSIQRPVDVSTEQKAPKRAKRAKNFSIQKDILLVSGWLNILLVFCGFYAEVERTRPSGTTEQDRILEAKRKFRKDRGHSFTYEHCWNLLKHHPKWSLELSRKIPKKGHTMNPTTPVVLSNVPDKIDLIDSDVQSDVSTFLERPMGKKAAKTMERKSKSKEKAEATQMELKDYFAVKVEHIHKEHEQFQLMYDEEQENIKLRKQEL